MKLTKTTGNIAVYEVEVVGSKLREVTFLEFIIKSSRLNAFPNNINLDIK